MHTLLQTHVLGALQYFAYSVVGGGPGLIPSPSHQYYHTTLTRSPAARPRGITQGLHTRAHTHACTVQYSQHRHAQHKHTHPLLLSPSLELCLIDVRIMPSPLTHTQLFHGFHSSELPDNRELIFAFTLFPAHSECKEFDFFFLKYTVFGE